MFIVTLFILEHMHSYSIHTILEHVNSYNCHTIYFRTRTFLKMLHYLFKNKCILTMSLIIVSHLIVQTTICRVLYIGLCAWHLIPRVHVNELT